MIIKGEQSPIITRKNTFFSLSRQLSELPQTLFLLLLFQRQDGILPADSWPCYEKCIKVVEQQSHRFKAEEMLANV